MLLIPPAEPVPPCKCRLCLSRLQARLRLAALTLASLRRLGVLPLGLSVAQWMDLEACSPSEMLAPVRGCLKIDAVMHRHF